MMAIIIIIVVLAAAIFGALLFIYDMAFAAKRGKHPDPEMMPSADSQYTPYTGKLRSSVRRLESIPFESVQIRSFDGLRLSGRYYSAGPDAPVAIMFHGFRSCAVRDACGGAPFCLSQGVSVLLVDQRCHGLSEGRSITFGVKERRDCLSWIEYVIGRFGSDVRIMLMGVSMGGATVLMAADLDLPHNVRAIAADCPYSDPEEMIAVFAGRMGIRYSLIKPFVRLAARLLAGFRLTESSPLRSVRQTSIPITLIHGDDDRFVPCDMSRALKNANPDKCTLVEIPGAGHGIAYMVNTPMYEAAAGKVCELLKAE